MQSNEINRILKKYKGVFDALERYDRERILPFHRKRIDLTLSVATLNKLGELKERTGKPISQIIEERFNQ